MRWLIGMLTLSLAVACAAGKQRTGDDDVGEGGTGANTSSGTTSSGTGGATSSSSSSSSSSSASSSASSSSSSSASSSSSSSSGGSGGTCYANQGDCNPMTPSCAAGEACDVEATQLTFVCFPPPNDAQLGGACDNTNGPYCAHGLTCVSSVCERFCCTNDDCSGSTCTEIGQSGTVIINACL